MSTIERPFVKCPIGGQKCDNPQCVEYHGTPEQPCRKTGFLLAQAVGIIYDANVAMGYFPDPQNPTREQIEKALNLSHITKEAARRLGIDETVFFYWVVRLVARHYKGAFK